ncbi:MAG TPA: radical SAM protein [Oscillospiraceae bacterium]|nr:radical SAM protein [Oscillospiraceae bacterium]HPS34499.1 radical SAM protein [Oscillospiraceae bacterium]
MICHDCPRNCGAARTAETGSGVCGYGTTAHIARAAPHFWEEPCVSGEKGSGTVFFCGCALGCVYCQNAEINNGENRGRALTPEQLREHYFKLIEQGVHNINLVTASHFTDAVIESLKGGLPVPVVYNCGGYEKIETIERLAPYIDVWMPDLKYTDSALAARYSRAPDYPRIAKAVIIKMYELAGDYQLDENGMIQKGVIIRHLILPEHLENTYRAIDFVKENFKPGKILFSLMAQYTPMPNGGPKRKLSADEYEAAQEYLFQSGIEDGFIQEPDSSGEEFIPDFKGM